MKTTKKLLVPLGGIIVLLLLVAYIGGALSSKKVFPGKGPLRKRKEPTLTTKAKRSVLPVWYDAVGTVHSVRQIKIAPQVRARIVLIEKSAGDAVKKNEVLIRLDDAEFQSRVRQAKQGVFIAKSGFLQAKQSLIATQAQVRQMKAYHLQAIQSLLQTKAQQTQAKAGFAQAQQRLVAAVANNEQAASEYRRTKKFKQEGASTEQEFEAAQAGFNKARAEVEMAKQGVAAADAQVMQLSATVKQAEEGIKVAEAQVEQTKAAVEQAKEGVTAAAVQIERAKEIVNETSIVLQYTTIKAPENGIVSERMAEPGDLALPGKPLLILHDPKHLRLEANVPESLLDKIRPGMEFPGSPAK